jgi:micrococcal nuclease
MPTVTISNQPMITPTEGPYYDTRITDTPDTADNALAEEEEYVEPFRDQDCIHIVAYKVNAELRPDPNGINLKIINAGYESINIKGWRFRNLDSNAVYTPPYYDLKPDKPLGFTFGEGDIAIENSDGRRIYSDTCLDSRGNIKDEEDGDAPPPTLISTTSPQTPVPGPTANVSIDRFVSVTNIVDGDTIYVDYKEKVRFVGVNTPEIGQAGSSEAKKYVSDRIMGKQVYLDVDDKKRMDMYGRTLATIFIEGVNLNAELLCKGFAEVMYYPPSEFDPYSWKASCAVTTTPPPSPTTISSSTTTSAPTASNCISIYQFNYDAIGNDNYNLNDEYVTFQNKCNTPIEMKSWTIEDLASNFYTFPVFTLDTNSKVTLYTGSGSDSDTQLYWNRNQAVWNNDGDTLFLRDQRGNIVLEYKYP